MDYKRVQYKDGFGYFAVNKIEGSSRVRELGRVGLLGGLTHF